MDKPCIFRGVTWEYPRLAKESPYVLGQGLWLTVGSGTLCRGSGTGSWYAGRRNEKHDPCPGVLIHHMVPPN